MKNIFLTLALVLGLAGSSFAQNEEYKSVVCGNAAMSLVGDLIDLADDASGATSTSLPAFQLTYDYGVNKTVSVGIAVSYQSLGVEYVDYDDGFETLNGDVTLNRLNFAIRPLFHYANSGMLDMYSGLRIGFTNWSAKSTVDSDTYDPESLISSGNTFNFAPQLVLFGMRVYFTDNIGLNLELAAGAPHYFSGGISARF